MYLPSHFEQADQSKAFDLIEANPLATLIVQTAKGLNVNHIPFYLERNENSNGRLLGHVPRANPLSTTAGTCEALAIFHGPNSYITPSWYATKKQTAKVVPTWNYQVVHLTCSFRIIDDPAWLLAQLEKLTNHNESLFSEPWSVSDAPVDFVAGLIKSLVGLELVISKLTAKTKASQNQPQANRQGVVDGLLGLGTDASRAMAELVQQGKS